MKSISEEQITSAGQSVLKPLKMSSHRFSAVHSPDYASKDTLVFLSNEAMLKKAYERGARGFIIHEKSFPQLQNLIPENSSVWTTPHIQFAMTKILPLFDRKTAAYPVGIHPTAVIHAEAKIAATASVGPYAVVQQGVNIGESTRIGSHTILEAFSRVGSNSQISPHVFIGSYCEIGSGCTLAPNVTIGSDGFGFFTDRSGNHKIPQIGKVIIEDNCEIGGGCVIDRATLEHTIIKSGSKLDNLCHIAHNVEIGENALIAGAFKIAGSTKIGKNLMTSGNVDVIGHIEICDNVILTARTGVTSSIETPGMYGGFPAEPHRDNIKNMVSFSHLSRIRKNVQKIMKHLNLDDPESKE